MKDKKKVKNRKIIVSIMTIIFAVALYVPYIPKMQALSNVTSSNNYGGYTWQIIDTMFDMEGNVTLSSAQISMNLNGHYNGSFTINISLSTIIDTTGIGYTNTINNYGFICNGCRITTYDSSHLYVAITDCNYWEIQIIPIKNASIKNWKSILNAFDISSITGWSMTKLDEITATQISTIQSTLTNINSNALTIHSDLNTTNTELHNIYNAISSGGTYGSIQSQLYNMGVNLSAEITQTIAIKNKIDSYLSGIIDNQTVSIWDLQNDANYSLSNMETTLNTISSHINDYTSQLNSIQSTLNSINTAVQNIDSTIDTISWNVHDYRFTWTRDFENFNNTVGNQLLNYSNNSVYILTDLNIYNSFNLIKLKLPYNITSATIDIKDIKVSVYGKNGNTLRDIAGGQYYIKKNGYYIEVYLYDYDFYPKSSGTQIYVYLYTTNKNITLYEYYTSGTISYIDTNDIEYWQLVQYFNSYNSNIRMIQALENINMSVTNTTIQDTTTNINDYNTVYNQVSNVEQTYINEYNTNNTTLQSIINDKKGIPDNIVNVSTDIESKMGQLFTVPEFKYLFALIISGCVLLALLG